jgi:hypothetical protein
MPKLVCSSCGADFPSNWRQAWGKHYATHGLGPEMKCGELVPNGLVAPLPDNKTDEQCPMELRIAKQVCGGQLVPATGTLSEDRAKEYSWHG